MGLYLIAYDSVLEVNISQGRLILENRDPPRQVTDKLGECAITYANT